MNWQGGARTHDPTINSRMLPPTELHANILYKTPHIEFVYNRGYHSFVTFNLPQFSIIFIMIIIIIIVHQFYGIFAEQVSLFSYIFIISKIFKIFK